MDALYHAAATQPLGIVLAQGNYVTAIEQNGCMKNRLYFWHRTLFRRLAKGSVTELFHSISGR